MLVISNHLDGKIPIPKEAVIRINLAWIKSVEEAREIIKNCKNNIYLDYPDGRTKPPKPTITFAEALELSKMDKVKYFAISNAENIDLLSDIKEKVTCELVPKIETGVGVKIIDDIIKLGIKMIMLDKDDLYVNCNCDTDLYRIALDEVRSKDIKILELQGVIFK